MRQTKTFGLNLFDGSDKVQCGKINENTEKIDAALRETTPTVGDIRMSVNDLEAETGGKFLALDGRVIDVERDYPGLADVYDLKHRLADGAEELAPSDGNMKFTLGGLRGVRLDGNFFYLYEYDVSGSNDYNYAAVLKADGTESTRLVDHAIWLGECAGQVVVLRCDDEEFSAFVLDGDGTMVREVQLASTSVTVRDVRVLENGGLLIVSSTGAGWFTDDNFVTHGACTWDGGTAAGTIPEGAFYGEVGRAIYELDGAVYVMVKTTTTTTGGDGFTHEADKLTAWRSADGGAFAKQWEFTPEERNGAANGPSYRSVLAVVPHDGVFAVSVNYKLPKTAGISRDAAGNYMTVYGFDNSCENRRINAETGETLLVKEYHGPCAAAVCFVRGGELHLAGSCVTSIGAYTNMAAPAPGITTSADVSVKLDLTTLEMEKTALIGALDGETANFVYVEQADCLMHFGGTVIRAVNMESGKYADLSGPQTESEEKAGIPFLPGGESKVYYPWSGGIAAIDLAKRKLYEMDFGYIKAK